MQIVTVLRARRGAREVHGEEERERGRERERERQTDRQRKRKRINRGPNAASLI